MMVTTDELFTVPPKVVINQIASKTYEQVELSSMFSVTGMTGRMELYVYEPVIVDDTVLNGIVIDNNCRVWIVNCHDGYETDPETSITNLTGITNVDSLDYNYQDYNDREVAKQEAERILAAHADN